MVAFTLLAIIVLCFVAQLIFPAFTGMFIFDPSVALTQPWRFITSIFLHGDLMHLFFNGYALFLFGTILEHKINTKNFLTLFFGAGLVGGILYYLAILVGIAAPIPALGASGAIFGILGALAILLPNMRIYLWFFPMKMWQAAVLWFFLEAFGTFNMSTSGIASAAHLGGLLFGILFAYYLKGKEKKQDEFIHYY